MEKSLNNCCIQFHNRENGVYFAGETVSGTVQLNLTKPRKYKAVTLRLYGAAVTSWTERRNKNRTTRYRGEQYYFKTYSDLIAGRTTNELEIGEHKFNFEFQLPSNLPSSLETAYGHIKYEVKVTVTKSNGDSSCFRALITVIANVNLNLIPSLTEPIMMTRSNTLSFLFANRGTIHMNVEVPHSGFVSGQDVYVKCSIKNDSTVKVNETKFSISSKTTHTALVPRHKRKYWTVKIVSAVGEGVDKGKEKQMTAILKIPPQPASTLNLCEVIKVEYTLKVKAVVNGMYSDLVLKSPITIGTIALQTNIDGCNMQTDAISQLQSFPHISDYSTTPGPSAPSEFSMTNLPTYDEVMNQDKVKRNFETTTKD